MTKRLMITRYGYIEVDAITLSDAETIDFVKNNCKAIDFDWEPICWDDLKIVDEFKDESQNTEEILSEEEEYRYQLLGRLQQDCKYYLGHGNRQAKYLWTKNEAKQISYMKNLYLNLPQKPEWISMEEIEEYKKQMLYASPTSSTTMKASRLIAMLQSYVDKKGDCEVIVRDIVKGENLDICSVGWYFDSEKIHIEI